MSTYGAGTYGTGTYGALVTYQVTLTAASTAACTNAPIQVTSTALLAGSTTLTGGGGSFVKQVGATKTRVVTSTTSLAAMRVFLRTLGVAATTSTALLKQARKLASSASTATVTKSIIVGLRLTRPTTATITIPRAMTRRLGFTVLGAANDSMIVKKILEPLRTLLTSGGLLTDPGLLTGGGAVGVDPIMSKLVGKSFSTSVISAGSMVTEFIVAAIIYAQNLSTTVTSAVTARRSVSATRTASRVVSVAIAPLRNLRRTITVPITTAPAFVRRVAKSVTTSSLVTVLLGRTNAQVLTAIVTVGPQIIKVAVLSRTAAVVSTATRSRMISKLVVRPVAASLAIAKLVAKLILTDTDTGPGIVREAQVRRSIPVASTISLARRTAKGVLLNAVSTVTLRKRADRAMTANSGGQANLGRSVRVVVSLAQSAVPFTAVRIGKRFVASAPVTATLAWGKALLRTLTASVGVAQSIRKAALKALRADSASEVTHYRRTFADLSIKVRHFEWQQIEVRKRLVQAITGQVELRANRLLTKALDIVANVSVNHVRARLVDLTAGVVTNVLLGIKNLLERPHRSTGSLDSAHATGRTMTRRGGVMTRITRATGGVARSSRGDTRSSQARGGVGRRGTGGMTGGRTTRGGTKNTKGGPKP